MGGTLTLTDAEARLVYKLAANKRLWRQQVFGSTEAAKDKIVRQARSLEAAAKAGFLNRDLYVLVDEWLADAEDCSGSLGDVKSAGLLRHKISLAIDDF